ncbi:MAG: putative esterase [Gemmatimonadetes bacterium]|nr:putative esterase [Gemmatimonadota bacterium]
MTLARLALFLCAATQPLLAQQGDSAAVVPLPLPQGQYAVGTAMLPSQRFTPARPRPGLVRVLQAQAWYPIAKAGAKRAPYIAQSALVDSMIARSYLDLPREVLDSLRNVRTAATLDAPAAKAPTGGWPLLLFSPGFGIARQQYTALVQQLASEGYVVIVLDHPFGGFALDAQGRVMQPGGDSLRKRLTADHMDASLDSAFDWTVQAWANEAVAALPALIRASRLPIDRARIGYLGHSIGGAAALMACASPLIRACADMDGDPSSATEKGGVAKNFLVLLSQPATSANPPADTAEANGRARRAEMGRARDLMWTGISLKSANDVRGTTRKLPGSNHLSFSDAPFVMPLLLWNTGTTLSAQAQFEMVSDLLLGFFRETLAPRSNPR